MGSCPCYECLCVPSCKSKTFIQLYSQCTLIYNYFNNLEQKVPLSCYQYIHVIGINHKYEVRKDFSGNCKWYAADGPEHIIATSTYH